MVRKYGFGDRRLCVVPRPVVEAALRDPLTGQLLVTDAGYFPEAAQHRLERPQGAPEAILLVCSQGSGWCEVAGQRMPVGVSGAVFIPTGVPHAYGSSADHPWSIWWLHVRGRVLPELGSTLGGGGTAPRVRSLPRIISLIDEIIGNLERGPTPPHLLANTGLAMHLFTRLAAEQVLPEEGDPVDVALRYLEERVATTVRVADLAALVNLSPSHLSALFRRATGGGVTAYHLALKMGRARQLLSSTSLPVGRIAAEVGFEDPLYFSRKFREVHGQTPTLYRADPRG